MALKGSRAQGRKEGAELRIAELRSKGGLPQMVTCQPLSGLSNLLACLARGGQGVLFHDDFDVLAAAGAFDSGAGSLLEMLGPNVGASAFKKKKAKPNKAKEARTEKAVVGVGRQKERAREGQLEGPGVTMEVSKTLQGVAQGGGKRGPGFTQQAPSAKKLKRALGPRQGRRKKDKREEAGRPS